MQKRKCALFTVQKNERFHLPIWVDYYIQHFDARDIFVLDHQSDDPGTVGYLHTVRGQGINVRTVEHELSFDHAWLLDTVHRFQKRILDKYEYCLFTDCDEWVMPAEGLLSDFIANATDDLYRCTGFEVIEKTQRRWPLFDKSLLTKIPLTYINGYHETLYPYPGPAPRDNLFLYHLKRLDRQQAFDKLTKWKAQTIDPVAQSSRMGFQNYGLSDEEFEDWFSGDHEDFKGVKMGTPTPWDERLAVELAKQGINA